MQVILIDSNKTIENHDKIKMLKSQFLSALEHKYNFTKNSLVNYSREFKAKHGDVLWEYHPIFWRSFVNDTSNTISHENLFSDFLDFYEENIELYDDVLDFLGLCIKRYKVVLVANGNEKRLERLIKKFNLAQWFNEIVVSGETPYKKPDRFMFEFALIRLGTRIEDAIMIGDRYDTDIIGAKKIGLKTVLIKRVMGEKLSGDTTPEYIPDFTVYNLQEAWELIDSCEKNKGVYANAHTYDETLYKNTKVTSALILAGGKGSRLGELGLKTQKCMLPFKGVPLLLFQISTLKNAGCNKFVIVINHLGEQIKEYFGNGEKFGIDIRYLEEKYISTYDAMYHALPYLDEKFFYCHGNIVFEERLIERMWNIMCKNQKSVLAVVKSAHSVTHAKLRTNNNIIEEISLKPREVDQNIYDYTFMGVAIYSKDQIEKNHDGNCDGMVEKCVKQLLEKDDTAYCCEYTGDWWHIETEDDYKQVRNKYFWEVDF